MVIIMCREYCLITGSQNFFDNTVSKILNRSKIITDIDDFLELLKLSELNRTAGVEKKAESAYMVVRNNHYHGITNEAHYRIGVIIEEMTITDAIIFIHNAPINLVEYINIQAENSEATVEFYAEQYTMEKNKTIFSEKMRGISENILGQNNAIEESTKTLWYLTNVERKKPYVVMLYGNSSLGKTELVKEIACAFFHGKYLEKYLSMFQNNVYADYFFGEKPTSKTLCYELKERESNLVFLDEIDKCPDYFYSAFYTLFDNTSFKDATYDADISGLVIFLTANFDSKDEIMKRMGLPIYYRIDKFIKFEEFNTDVIMYLTRKEIAERKHEFIEFCTEEEIYDAASPKIFTKKENGRTIKYKVQETIEEILYRQIQPLN